MEEKEKGIRMTVRVDFCRRNAGADEEFRTVIVMEYAEGDYGNSNGQLQLQLQRGEGRG